MPRRVREPYLEFIHNLKVRNTLAGGLGQEYERATGIPQGDPLSIMSTALLMRAWIIQMRTMGVVPRVLADDLQVRANGRNAMDRFINAFDKSHLHLHDIERDPSW